MDTINDLIDDIKQYIDEYAVTTQFKPTFNALRSLTVMNRLLSHDRGPELLDDHFTPDDIYKYYLTSYMQHVDVDTHMSRYTSRQRTLTNRHKPALTLINMVLKGEPKMKATEFHSWCDQHLYLHASLSGELYPSYTRSYDRRHRLNHVPLPDNDTFTLPYPFKSKQSSFNQLKRSRIINKEVKLHQQPTDPFPKKLKQQFSRPSFAPHPYSWEMDHIMYNNNATYLAFINVNTRYLYMIKVANRGQSETDRAFNQFIDYEDFGFDHPVDHIRADGDATFMALKTYYDNNVRTEESIQFYLQSSPYTYHNKIIDRVIRTMRDALNDDRLFDGNHDNIVQQLVHYYNNTKHRSLRVFNSTGNKLITMTPYEMHTNIEAEWTYIRSMTNKLNDVKKRQHKEGLHRYKPGDIVRVHLNYSKTPHRFAKRRRQFDTTTTFKGYSNGNAVVRIDNKDVEVPIYFIQPAVTGQK